MCSGAHACVFERRPGEVPRFLHILGNKVGRLLVTNGLCGSRVCIVYLFVSSLLPPCHQQDYEEDVFSAVDWASGPMKNKTQANSFSLGACMRALSPPPASPIP